MNRTVLTTALVALIAAADGCLAQASASLPVIRPKVTELGEIRDTTPNAELVPEEATLSPRGTLIAYSTRNDLRGWALRIWNVSSHSGRVVVNGFAESIVWSPAGNAIAFRHPEDKGSQEQIWIVRLNPVTGEVIGSPQRVTLTAPTELAHQFSPDGRWIAFPHLDSAPFPRTDSAQRSSVVVVPATGGTERVLASGYGIRNVRWAVDGSAIYYFEGSETGKRILRKVAVNGGAPRVVHDFTSESRTPSLSADNRVVLLSQEPVEPSDDIWAFVGAERAVRIGDPTGRALATLVFPAKVLVDEWPGDWSGDFSQVWSGEYRQVGVRKTIARPLRVVNVADGKSRELIDSTADVQAVAWFEDSRRLAAIAFHGDTGVLVTMNADGSGVRKIPLAVQPMWNSEVGVGNGWAQTLSVSPDGRYAVYLGPGRSSLVLVDLSTGKQRTLTRAALVVGQIFWHRDSRTIRYMQVGKRGAGLAEPDPELAAVHDVSLDGTDKQVRAFPTSQYPNLATRLVGERYVSVFGGNSFSLARLDGSADQLFMRGSAIRTPGVISPGGRTMAVNPGPKYSNKPSRRITLLSLSDGSQRSIDLPFSEIDCVAFSPDGRSLYCRGREAESGPQTIYDVPLDGSKPRVVTRIDTPDFMGESVLSPDGKWLLQTIAGLSRSAFVILDFTEGMTRLLASSSR